MSDTEPNPDQQLTVVPAAGSRKIARSVAASIVVPAIVADAGDQAVRRFLEFFAATIRNRNTRTAYLHAVSRFFAWCDHHKLGALADIEPLHVAAYIEALGENFEKPTVKQHLAAIRMLFDWLVTGQIVATNPAHAVRGPKHVVKTGKTTVLDAEQARRLLDSIDTSTVVGLRDRALISVMTFAFARIGAVVAVESKTLVVVASRDGMLVPRLIADAGDQAARRFLEFFAATIRNKNTRTAYYHAAMRFFAWCDHHKIGEIADIEPLHVAAYIEALGKDFEKPTVKQHLAAIRMLGRKARRRKIAR